MGKTAKQYSKSVCVFSGASTQVDPAYYDLATDCGQAIAKRNYRMVYGGGGIGLMGASARGARDAGGEVLGVIPDFLTEIEVVLDGVETRIVDDMHERKHMMYEESDAFIVLPGGIGTLEEAIEVMSWMRLKLHAKPMVFVDENQYWQPLLDLLNEIITAKFAPEWIGDHLFYEHSNEAALDLIEKEWEKPTPKGHIQPGLDEV